jgi:hypothetical protein
MMNMVECKINSFHHVWCWIIAHLEWLIALEVLKLKFESKASLLVAFRQKNPLSQKPCMLGVG